ncbi:hypothetical protein FK531_09235 [Rhodococcus spelaei]|uniref:Uncharacterized protein n=1 Tax=Rhodococcus spelaei TaxID=2546320 RepID=A0A541BN25_9NOCA|nr:hypothetical protein [Rhodococcus spelaei]TQF73736.1 hypothetical protein FK531_09235 [Rhodococcus spelaei]
MNTPPPQPSPAPASPQAPTKDLSLSSPAVDPGGEVTAIGEGCPAGSNVALTLQGQPVGHTVADGAGGFQAPVAVGSVDVGRYQVAANCGPILLASLDVVQASQVSTDTSTVTVIVFFLLIGMLIYRRRLLPPPSPRERS